MVPMLLGAMGMGSTAQAVGGFLENNLIAKGWLENALDPKMVLSPAMGNDGSLAAFSAGRYNFITQVIAPSSKDIKALDDFFEAYGYRIDQFIVPNIGLRSNFTYVKTKDCVVYSKIKPAADQMAAMLNNGYKFWKTEIGK